MTVFLALLLAAVQVEPPTTVNGDVLGKPEDFATAGPARVCLRDIAVTAKRGETVYLAYAGIHTGTLRLATGGRTIDFTHLESGIGPTRSARLVGHRTGVTLFRYVEGHTPRYIARISPADANGGTSIVRIGGSGLAGTDGAGKVWKHLSISTAEVGGCDRTYSYGWDMLFGEEPLSRKEKP